MSCFLVSNTSNIRNNFFSVIELIALEVLGHNLCNSSYFHFLPSNLGQLVIRIWRINWRLNGAMFPLKPTVAKSKAIDCWGSAKHVVSRFKIFISCISAVQAWGTAKIVKRIWFPQAGATSGLESIFRRKEVCRGWISGWRSEVTSSTERDV